MEDNYSLWERREREQERWLAKLPVCCECENPIQDEAFYEINGEYVCSDCLETNHKKWTDDYIS